MRNEIGILLLNSMLINRKSTALCINETFYTYKDLSERVCAIQKFLHDLNIGHNSVIGIFSSNTLDCYASIVASILSGYCFLPIAVDTPKDRLLSILETSSPSIILCCDDHSFCLFKSTSNVRIENTTLLTTSLFSTPIIIAVDESYLAYIIYTSGSTGTPKGVQITRKNLNAFYTSLKEIDLLPTLSDRVLHIFEFNFDFSISSYLIPLISGSTIHTLKKDVQKFSEIYRVLSEHKITIAPLVPSVLNYLAPYFEEIDLPDLRLCLFCGEPLFYERLIKWMKCCKNSKVVNFYGPTECTVFSHYYIINPQTLQINESGNIVSFGKPLQNVRSIIIDENLQEVEHGETGQLCLSGDQLTPGYLNNGMLNINSFFYFPPSSDIIYYKTGDLSFQDGDKNYYYSGRIDNQIKINGYRIELEDIEAIACQVTQRTCIALINDKCINSSIYLAIEGKILENHSDIFKLLSQKLPNYMIPTKIFYIDKFQLTSNMKINRKSLIEEIIYKHPIN